MGMNPSEKACSCEIISPDNLDLTLADNGESRSLVHKTCGGIYDPAFILREKRADRAGPHMSDAEYRADI